MNRLKIAQLKMMILEGESVSLDFKKTITSCHKIAKTMVSFANNKGGKLFIGVADNGSISGVKSEDEERYMIEKAATFFIKPLLEPIFEEIYIDDKIILVVDILQSEQKPHYALGEDEKWWVYIRVKDKSVLASKIVVDVLKREHKETGVLIEYGSKEKALLGYLETNDRITLKEFCEMLHLSKRRASKILVKLILMGLVRVHTSEKEEFYTAS
ncbi:putative DNA binding domain-containing protein [Pedobacter sp. SD-b]|uniref:DNA binding domain-containing protein n=1 Tax=Pedobacter segetis TaxID=2793069 RepID=A0ABS1BP20_9SPHI|nr:RNA-binding domain-containing protein [Pedobacter segetis]MBK0383979.1 putative DNA binding domain-containing protein [Pedobacter segetis]